MAVPPHIVAKSALSVASGSGSLIQFNLVLLASVIAARLPQTKSTSFRMILNDLAYDLRRYSFRLGMGRAAVILLSPGFHAMLVYRIAHALLPMTSKRSLLTSPIAFLMSFVQRFTEMTTGISIDPRAEIGQGLMMVHFGNIFIGPCRIGRNCDIFQDVTLGVKNSVDLRVPTLGDRVYLAPGAKVLGDLTLGNDVVVGPNSVLLQSVPDRAVVLGIPARVMAKTGSFEHVLYPDMEADADRQASLRVMLAETQS